jgi:hypothetical protein
LVVLKLSDGSHPAVSHIQHSNDELLFINFKDNSVGLVGLLSEASIRVISLLSRRIEAETIRVRRSFGTRPAAMSPRSAGSGNKYIGKRL